MSVRWFLVCTLILAPFLSPAPKAQAQNGRLIEGLFRTLAESQLERERRKRLEAEEQARRDAQQRANQPNQNPYEVKLPSGFGPPADPRPNPRPGTLPPLTGTINVRSQEAAEYVEALVQFNQSYSPLANDLRAASVRNPNLRAIMPSVYEISASTNTLMRQCDGIRSLSSITRHHQELDHKWRGLAYRLREIGGLSDACNTAIRRCDELCGTMGGCLNIQPQFDRIGLRDQMVVGATYMQTLVDDLSLASLSPDRCHSLEHDCRLLRQRLVSASRHVDELSYDEAVGQFNQFSADWRKFAAKLYALNDPYLSRRLDRVSEVGANVYALLRMTPPISAQDFAPYAVRIKQNMDQVTQRISLRSLASLPPAEQVRVLESIRQLNDLTQNMVTSSSAANPQLEQLKQRFLEFDDTWHNSQPLIGRIQGVSRSNIDEIERQCHQLREMLHVHVRYDAPLQLSQLIHPAAALEGASEYLQRTLIRFDNEIRPSSVRNEVIESSKRFYRHAREVHELLSRRDRLEDRRHLERLQDETSELLKDWNSLSRRLSQLQAHGLNATTARQILSVQQDIVPYVAQLSAALTAR